MSIITPPTNNPAAKHHHHGISIHLDDHHPATIYSGGSRIAGNVAVTPPSHPSSTHLAHAGVDTKGTLHYDRIEIVLEGRIQTVDVVNYSAVTEHVFLRQTMPVPFLDGVLPARPRTLPVGAAPLAVPFNFVLPATLTVGACSHPTQHQFIHDVHTRLPPTMGGGSSANRGGRRDDMAPYMAKVEYTLRATLFGAPDAVLLTAMQRLRVLPAAPEDPPLPLCTNDRLYAPTKTKAVRKALFARHAGRLTASVAQPRAAMLSPDGCRLVRTPAAAIDLVYEPLGADATPPRINSVCAKVVATTYFTSRPMPSLPHLGPARLSPGAAAAGASPGAEPLAASPWEQIPLSYTNTLTLSTSCFDGISWVVRRPANEQRRDSGYSTSDEGKDAPGKHVEQARRTSSGAGSRRSSSSSCEGAPGSRLAATLRIPLPLPTDKKLFLPTFHSCLVARVYTVQLAVSAGPYGATTTLNLAVPLQVGVEPRAPQGPRVPQVVQGQVTTANDGADEGGGAELPPAFDHVVEADEGADADALLRLPPGGGGARREERDGALPEYRDLVAPAQSRERRLANMIGGSS